MKVYTKFIVTSFLKSFLYVSIVFFSLVLILNTLTEVEFFQDIEVKAYFPIYISFLNSPALLFEMFPFIFLVSTQAFFIKMFSDNQIQIFKYSGLRNSKILGIICFTSLIMGTLIILLFYSLSSNLKNIYLEEKNRYTIDDKYLAVVTKNGLWIKDEYENKSIIVHAKKINNNILIDAFITQYNNKYEVIRHIQSDKINIENNNWLIFNAKIYENNLSKKVDLLKIYSNFNYKKIQSLYSDLSSLSIVELYSLRNNYKLLNYSTTEVNLQIQKLISYPAYLFLMTILSSIIMFNTKNFTSVSLKICIGLFFSVIIYYINNFFLVMGKTEKISIIFSVWMPLLFLLIINTIMTHKINEK
jgi:lipopolysaccharide export system permease protein